MSTADGLSVAAAAYRAGHQPGNSWWVVLPVWMRPITDQVKKTWPRLAGHPLGDLRGFEFWGGPRFTYDQATDAWREETPEPEDTPIVRGL